MESAVAEELTHLYRRHGQGLYSLALSITGCGSAAEDAVHDAFRRMLRLGAAPNGDGRAYVFTAVRNAAIDLVRRGRSVATRDGSLFQLPASDPIAGIEHAERRVQLARAVDGLCPTEREAVVLRVYGELTFEEIARVTGESVGTTSSRYYRAVKRLGAALGGRLD